MRLVSVGRLTNTKFDDEMNTGIKEDIEEFRTLAANVSALTGETIPVAQCNEIIAAAMKVMSAVGEKLISYPSIDAYGRFDELLRTIKSSESEAAYNEACSKMRQHINAVIDMRTDAYNEGQEHAVKFLQSELDLARAKVAKYEGEGIHISSTSIATAASSLEEVTRERDLLATVIRDSAARLGLVRPGASLSSMRLAKLVADISENLSDAISPQQPTPAMIKQRYAELSNLLNLVDGELDRINAPETMDNRVLDVRADLDIIKKNEKDYSREKAKESCRDLDHIFYYLTQNGGN